MRSRLFVRAWKKPEAAGLPEPVGFEFGEGGLRGAGPGDGDKKAPGVGKSRRVSLDERAEAASHQVAVVSFFGGPLGGDETSAEGIQLGIGQGA